MSILDAVGNTPLFRLHNVFTSDREVAIYAKGEFLNPSGSVKDRAAKAMLLQGIRSGKLKKGQTILDATSGSTGMAYAMMGAAMGYRVLLCMPSNVSLERKRIIRAYGAEMLETDPLEGADGAFYMARELAEAEPERYFYPDQYNNDANWQAHYNTTALEIWEQTGQSITHFVAGTGTSGTFMGTSRRLKELSPEIQCIIMQPDSPFHGLEGLKHMESTLNPGIYDKGIADAKVEVGTEEAYEMTKRLAREEGLFVGISSGANVLAAIEVAKNAPAGSQIVTILCDGGYRYLSEPLWEGLD
ncbi:MAG: cysteine synthase family protein [Lachnospiraceae bacterium]|nr:cysteine synthase family protein [Lachnospiraceae bacterium]